MYQCLAHVTYWRQYKALVFFSFSYISFSQGVSLGSVEQGVSGWDLFISFYLVAGRLPSGCYLQSTPVARGVVCVGCFFYVWFCFWGLSSSNRGSEKLDWSRRKRTMTYVKNTQWEQDITAPAARLEGGWKCLVNVVFKWKIRRNAVA